MQKDAEQFYALLSGVKSKKIKPLFSDGCTGMYAVLKIVNDADGCATAGEIARRLDVSTARVAVLLTTLQKKSWIRKEKSPSDSRKTLVFLTQEGAVALKKRKSEILELIDRLFSVLEESERASFYSTLQKLLAD